MRHHLRLTVLSVSAAALLGMLFAACGGDAPGLATIVVSSYDTICVHDGDCVPIIAGPISCCVCPNAAISRSDDGDYVSDLAAAESDRGACAGACGACPAVTSVCVQGTCAVTAAPDAGSDGP
jgi:hypothetical protein